jgi:formylglycine-generating enzyme required for sulfatase activity
VVAITAAEVGDEQPLTASVWQRPWPSEPSRQALAWRQAAAALVLALLGQTEPLWSVLKGSPDPESRSRLVHRLGPGGVEARGLIERLEREQDDSVRRALVLALGEYGDRQVPAKLRQGLVPTLLRWYRDDPDPGLHGAIDWLLRHPREGSKPRPLAWGQGKQLRQIDEELAGRRRAGRPARDRGWYVNGQGQTLVVVDARRPFLMGARHDEAGRRPEENLHWRHVRRRFAIANRPVTGAEFERFLKANPAVKYTPAALYSPSPDCPVVNVKWYEAAQYCRWLSEQEGVPEHQMCYPSVAEIEKCKDGRAHLRLPPDYLKRRGYRLPTEAEWEFACRAGTRTSRYYGSAPDLLPRYAWYVGNTEDRTEPVGQLKPNDLGLFEMLGNVLTWCQEGDPRDQTGTREAPGPDEEDRQPIVEGTLRAARGSAFTYHQTLVRAAPRYQFDPQGSNFTVGLRVVRTCD